MKLRRFFACMMTLLLVCSQPLTVFAAEYDLSVGSVTVNASESGQTVTQENNPDRQNYADSNPVITQSSSSPPTSNTITVYAAENATANVTIQDVNIANSDPSGSPQNHGGQAAITIDVSYNASANVTLDDVNIDVSGTGNIRKKAPGEAAVQITGNGDVTLELDGTNTVQSGSGRAGVEKNTIAATSTNPGNGNGNLTITDENGTAGSLESTGGLDGSGIGGGHDRSGSNITITGTAEVTAQGGLSASGIGGGAYRNGSNINISGGKVTATGGNLGAGIGGGQRGNGSEITISGGTVEATGGENDGAGIGGGAYGSGSNIKISGTAEVTAKGGNYGSGIGGGYKCSGSNITISQDAQVKAQGGKGGKSNSNPEVVYGAGAAIGNGGKSGYSNSRNLNGAEATPNTDELTPNGKIEYYAPDANMETGVPIKAVTGTYVPPQPENPVQPAQPEEEAPQTTALYRVVGQDGKSLACKTEQKDGVLTITVEADFATLTGSLSGMKTLKAQGVDTIVFVTNGATSTFAIADLLAQGGDSYALTHDGETVTFTLGNDTDISKILK